jgi:PAS domain S-box-containing protein
MHTQAKLPSWLPKRLQPQRLLPVLSASPHPELPWWGYWCWWPIACDGIGAFYAYDYDCLSPSSMTTPIDQSQPRLKLLIEQSPLAIIEWNTKFEIQVWNPAAERIFGYLAKDVIGQHFGFFVPEEYRPYVDQVAAGILNQDGGSQAINENLTADGRRITCEWFNAPLKTENGEVIGAVSMVMDISDRLKAAALLQEKNQELATALQELQTAQLQTIQSEKMASLGNLVAGIGHEINNPMGFLKGSISHVKEYCQALVGQLELYEQHCPDAPLPIHLNATAIDLDFIQKDLPQLLIAMEAATNRITGISTSLRTFSRADTDQAVIADLHECLDSNLMMLKYRLKANDFRPAIVVSKDYGDIPRIPCFPGQLNQVFMNILANAIDVFDEVAQQCTFAELQTKPQTITIQTAMVQQHVEIRMRDNGKGMPEAVKSRIFDHLFTTKGVGKGTGLGLAIARQIIAEKHSGSLTVESTVGQGTEFCIRLPILLD